MKDVNNSFGFGQSTTVEPTGQVAQGFSNNLGSTATMAAAPQNEGGMMFEMMDGMSQSAVIKVIGVGGGGGNAVQHMVNSGIEGVDFICANTDAQALHSTLARTTIQLGSNVTKGLGAGANPEIGREAALEDRERIAEMIQGTDMLFITAGMGGGTGTGAAPVIAQLAKEMGVLTVAVVTKPFPFEGAKRMALAMQGMDELSKYVDSLITVPNEKLLTVLGREATLLSAFAEANNVLLYAVQGIAELITRPGLINVDFADVRTVMSEMGMAMMGAGQASGADRAAEATATAIASPLLEEVDLAGAKGLLVNVTAGLDMGIGEFDEVGQMINDIAANDATVVIGTTVDPELQDQLRVTVVATGIGGHQRQLQPVRSSKQETIRPAAPRATASMTPAAPPVRTPVNTGNAAVDYSNLDRPTVMRNADTASSASAQPVGNTAAAVDMNAESYESVLDIPAFLRRQAD